MSAIRRIGQTMRLVFRVDRARATLVVICLLVTSSAGGAMALAVKALVNSAVARDAHAAILAALILAVGQGVTQIVNNVQNNLCNMLSQEVSAHVDRDVLRMVSGVPTIEHFERPDYLDRVSLVVGKGDEVAGATWSTVNAIGLALRLIVAMTLLATVHPALAVLPAFAIPALAATRKSQRVQQAAEEQLAQAQRLSHSLHNLFLDAASAKELRVFNATDALSKRSDDLWQEINDVRMQASLSATLWAMAGWACFLAAFAVTLAVVALRATRGQGSAGEAALVVQLANQIRGQVAMASGTVQDLVKAFTTMRRLGWIAEYETSSRRTPGTARVPSALRQGIRFENVTFRYPGTDFDVLQHIDLDIPAGSSFAIVGDNGAGKTSLVKLLCGYYLPTEGRITVDGARLDDFDVEAWRAVSSGAFQDFARFETILRESVGTGDLARADNIDEVLVALERGAATDLSSAWPDGLDAHVGKIYRNGVEPSGGQWQKIAVSRAMMRLPLLLVLDEPTSALDAATEDELFRRYTDAAEVGRASGAITVLVSHRFSTVRAAERIIVLEQGRISEQGTHDELMTLAGRYAEMFRLQSAAYHSS